MLTAGKAKKEEIKGAVPFSPKYMVTEDSIREYFEGGLREAK